MQFKNLFRGAAAASVLAVVGTLAATVPTNAATLAAVDDSYSTVQNEKLAVDAPGVLGNDTGSNLTAVLVGNPTHGSVVLGTHGAFVYTPANDYFGPDSFTYKANDGTNDSNTATVKIKVDAVPHAWNDAYTVRQGTARVVAAPGVLGNDTDADKDTLTAVKVSSPVHGTLSLQANGGFTYIPDAGYVGMDSFKYQATDGTIDSNTGKKVYSNEATVTTTVTKDAAPVAVNDSYSTPKGKTLYVAAPGVLGNDTDADKDTLKAFKVSTPAHGTLTLQRNGAFTYAPAADFAGTDSFTYKASDGLLFSNDATVTITVTAPAPAPAPAAASLLIGTSRHVITYGQGVTIHATLKQGTTPLKSQTVSLQRCALVHFADKFICGPWETIDAATTDANGMVSFRYFPYGNAHYRWVFAGTSEIAPAISRTATVWVRTAVFARASAHWIHRHHAVKLIVTVRPNHARQFVILQRFVHRVGWVHTATLRLYRVNATTSRAAIWLRPWRTFLFRFVKPADANHARGVSNTVVVHVR